MGIRPDFLVHVRQLKTLGVCDEQISDLRKALLSVRRILAKPAANGASELLADVQSLSSDLLSKLHALCLGFDSEHNKACGLIETSYGQQRPNNTGPTSMHHLIPCLRACSWLRSTGSIKFRPHSRSAAAPLTRLQASAYTVHWLSAGIKRTRMAQL